MIKIWIPGQPVAKGRPRFAKRGKFTKVFTDEKTARWENLVALATAASMVGKKPMEGALLVDAIFWLKRPKSIPKKVKFPVKKPDLDNMVKALLDGMTQGGIWGDDSQVVDLASGKRYELEGQGVGVSVTVAEMEE